MKTPTLLLALALATTTAAFLPTADAAASCTFLEPHCPDVFCYGWSQSTGWQYCIPNIPDPIIVCVTDPCPQPLP